MSSDNVSFANFLHEFCPKKILAKQNPLWHLIFVIRLFLSGYSGFLPRFKDMCVRLTGDPKSAVDVCLCVIPEKDWRPALE